MKLLPTLAVALGSTAAFSGVVLLVASQFEQPRVVRPLDPWRSSDEFLHDAMVGGNFWNSDKGPGERWLLLEDRNAYRLSTLTEDASEPGGLREMCERGTWRIERGELHLVPEEGEPRRANVEYSELVFCDGTFTEMVPLDCGYER